MLASLSSSFNSQEIIVQITHLTGEPDFCCGSEIISAFQSIFFTTTTSILSSLLAVFHCLAHVWFCGQMILLLVTCHVSTKYTSALNDSHKCYFNAQGSYPIVLVDKQLDDKFFFFFGWIYLGCFTTAIASQSRCIGDTGIVSSLIVMFILSKGALVDASIMSSRNSYSTLSFTTVTVCCNVNLGMAILFPVLFDIGGKFVSKSYRTS